ncbi:hypothetical protein HD806DRAFT_550479 [Xylariaceae sp. AK1471]|nr:hypothetical protein HD806DRAFT_550479 [Xylariaceae sp. AK1471]
MGDFEKTFKVEPQAEPRGKLVMSPLPTQLPSRSNSISSNRRYRNIYAANDDVPSKAPLTWSGSELHRLIICAWQGNSLHASAAFTYLFSIPTQIPWRGYIIAYKHLPASAAEPFLFLYTTMAEPAMSALLQALCAIGPTPQSIEFLENGSAVVDMEQEQVVYPEQAVQEFVSAIQQAATPLTLVLNGNRKKHKLSVLVTSYDYISLWMLPENIDATYRGSITIIHKEDRNTASIYEFMGHVFANVPTCFTQDPKKTKI